MSQRGIAAAGEREDDVKMLPEQLVVEGGVGGRGASAPIEVVEAPEASRSGRLVALPAQPVLRLSQVVDEPAVVPAPTGPAPMLLTAVVTPPPAGGENDAAWTGAALRRARESRGVSLAELADRTKITRHHLENIEGDRHDRLPSYVYLRGILLSLAKELRLDGLQVTRSYIENARRAAGDLH